MPKECPICAAEQRGDSTKCQRCKVAEADISYPDGSFVCAKCYVQHREKKETELIIKNLHGRIEKLKKACEETPCNG